tara:strand:- start:582 stop:1058 length:477 start_codon:yes stop_codon:yes gene_type:complete
MKNLLICSLLSLLGSCSLFSHVPQSVIEGQRAVYQSAITAEQNANKIIDRYVKDTKASVTYHLHYVCEKEILELEDEDDDYPQWTENRKETLRNERDRKIKRAHADIDKIAKEMRQQIMRNAHITRRLVGSVYNYLSTTPVEVDNIGYWVEQLHNGSK